ELQPSEVRQRYTILAFPHSTAELVERLLARFAHRERTEIARIGTVLALVTHDGCQVNSLVAYFGETRTQPCGHCTHCLTGHAGPLPEPEPKPPLETAVSARELRALADREPNALGTARQRARFLAGITSPATTRVKLTKDPLFGALAERRFSDVL